MASKPKPRDLGSELGSIGGSAAQYAQAMANAAVEANGRMIAQALEATDTISKKLNNEHTAKALVQIGQSADGVPMMRAVGDRLGALAGMAEDDLGGTEIERMLTQSALDELQLGRSLSAEEQRDAVQGARAGLSARGLGTGTSSALAEILARNSYGTQREASRRNFASGVNQMTTGNRLQRLGQTGALLGQTAGVAQNASQLGLQIGQAYIASDPYQRALGSNIPVASQGPSASLASNAFGQVLQYGSDLYNTNNNAAWSDYLRSQNLGYAAGLPGAAGMNGGMMALGGLGGAATGAAAGAMMGSVVPGIGTAAGAVAGGLAGGLGGMSMGMR